MFMQIRDSAEIRDAYQLQLSDEQMIGPESAAQLLQQLENTKAQASALENELAMETAEADSAYESLQIMRAKLPKSRGWRKMLKARRDKARKTFERNN